MAELRHREAAEFFLQAMQIEAHRGAKLPDMRHLSYYGLSLAMSSHVSPDAVEACELAVSNDPSKPVLLLNLGRIYLMSGRRVRALQCLERGARLAPNNRLIARALGSADRRAAPMITFLDRGNPLNRIAGRLRARLHSRCPDGQTAKEARQS